MRNHYRLALSALAFLCSQGLTAHAGSIGYEALDGNRCNVSTDTPPQLEFNSGYNETQGTNASLVSLSLWVTAQQLLERTALSSHR